MHTIQHLVDGQDHPGSSGRTGPVYNPATGSETARGALASEADVDHAVASAVSAFTTWRLTSLAQRTKLMHRFRNLVEANADELAAIISAEHGKVRSDAAGEVARALENVEFACGLADQDIQLMICGVSRPLCRQTTTILWVVMCRPLMRPCSG